LPIALDESDTIRTVMDRLANHDEHADLTPEEAYEIIAAQFPYLKGIRSE